MVRIMSVFWTGLEVSCYFLFFAAFLKRSKNALWMIGAFCAAWGLGYVWANFFDVGLWNQVVAACIPVVLSFLVYRGKWYYRILSAVGCSFLFAILDTAVGYGVSYLRGVSYSELMFQRYTYLTVATAAKLLELLVAWLVFRGRRLRHAGAAKVRWLLFTLLFPAISMVMLIVLFYSFQHRAGLSSGVLIFSIAVGAANAASFYMIHKIEQSTDQQQEIALLNQQMAIKTESIISLEQSYRAQRKATHDFNSHLETIQRLLSDGDLPALTQYLEHLQMTQARRVLYMNSHHSIIDAVMNQKCQTAMDADIDIQVQVNDLSGVRIETDLLVVLLSNLLDNAIEACLRTGDERRITCKFLLENGAFFLSVRNSSLPVTIVDNAIETSKTPKKDHGYGLNIIRRILDQLRAEYSFCYEDGYFHFVAEIPNEEDGTD